ncbi:hypothetical protein DRO02_05785 [archaeon]|nr:MAG: hypothetical protein DRO02_05785 [archaeon]RLG64155.1 MAG: hypothetical protein DRO21_04575 [archaeon]HDM24017.1 hypothetical protein [Candidatus Bathyarchaeota archaeon]
MRDFSGSIYFELSILSMLAAIPTALGYVTGPISHAINSFSELIFIHIPVGFILVAYSILLARLIVNRLGIGFAEGLIVGLLGAFFHPGGAPFLKLIRDIAFGVAVDAIIFKSISPSRYRVFIAGALASPLCFIPYLFFAPIWNISASTIYMVALISVNIGDVIAGIIAAMLAYETYHRVLPLLHFNRQSGASLR